MSTADHSTRDQSTTQRAPKMRAIVHHEYGTADVMRLDRVPRPGAKGNEVLVRVHAAGLDRGVWHVMTGLPYLGRLAFGPHRPKQPVLGFDLAGTVVEVGPAVTRFSAGDEVYGFGKGAFAEYALAGEDKLSRKPANLSFEQAAVVPVSAVTALQALTVGRLERGQTVLVTGASGGVGSYAVQLAKALGAEVTGVCSAAKADLVRSIGADRVLDYSRDDFADGAHRYDLIIDIAGNPTLSQLRRALTPRGTAVIVGGEQGGNFSGGMNRQFRALLWSLVLRQRFAMALGTVRSAGLEHLTDLIEAGSVSPSLEATYPLERAPEAMRRFEQGLVRGKVAITL
ncbi:NAD(P)-dependent alcohol dehydrogenase [Occultella aeris]|uniref:Crotonyl-CoA reductase n=1 Tax=Occultella aeris TaxID=2761496 RepID=A0A7M4DJX2_9MICO|nr:NAD(P)-dependent alcohol dehydrogenase [Occultella aeris]VZO37359.1 Crotonyl-CoA reductase [Occultella aeris]